MLNWCASMRCIKRLNFCRNAHFQRTGPHPLLVDFDLMASASWRIFFLVITRSHAQIASQGNVFGSHGWQRLLLAKNGTRRCGSLSKRPKTCKHKNSFGFEMTPLSLQLTTDFTLCMATWSAKSWKNFTGVLKINKYICIYDIWTYFIYSLLQDGASPLPSMSKSSVMVSAMILAMFSSIVTVAPCMVRYSLRLNNI